MTRLGTGDCDDSYMLGQTPHAVRTLLNKCQLNGPKAAGRRSSELGHALRASRQKCAQASMPSMLITITTRLHLELAQTRETVGVLQGLAYDDQASQLGHGGQGHHICSAPSLPVQLALDINCVGFHSQLLARLLHLLLQPVLLGGRYHSYHWADAGSARLVLAVDSLVHAADGQPGQLEEEGGGVPLQGRCQPNGLRPAQDGSSPGLAAQARSRCITRLQALQQVLLDMPWQRSPPALHL